MNEYMNPIKSVSANCNNEPLITIHCDGRVSTSDRLKPEETAALVLDQIKTQWLKDAQATKIRELQDRIKRMEEALEGTVKWIVDLADSGDAGFWNPEEQSVIIAARAALQAKEAKL